MPPGIEPGLEVTHVMQVPTGTDLPTADGRVQMYPCHSFEFHVVLAAIDPELGKTELRRYVIGHDCGTVINPHIVKGMTLGGIAHGIGAALMEEFVYGEDGQMLSQSFMDYLLPSRTRCRRSRSCITARPRRSRCSARKARASSAISARPPRLRARSTMRCAPLGIAFDRLPIRITAIGDAVAAARADGGACPDRSRAAQRAQLLKGSGCA